MNQESQNQDQTEQELTTFHGVSKWFKSVFERYGWMTIVATKRIKNVEDNRKIENYTACLDSLQKTLFNMPDIIESGNHVYSLGERHDLNVMLKKVNRLIEAWTKCKMPNETSSNNQSGGANKKSKGSKSKSKGSKKKGSKSKSKGSKKKGFKI